MSAFEFIFDAYPWEPVGAPIFPQPLSSERRIAADVKLIDQLRLSTEEDEDVD